MLVRVTQGDGNADGSVGFVTVGVRREPRIVLRNPAEIAQSRGPVITGPGVYPGQVYSHGETVPGSVPRIRTLAAALSKLIRVSERFVVTGGNRLSGEVAVGGAKNSVLKLMAATLLAEGTSTITNCPDILDVPLMAEVLRGLGR